MIKASLAYHNPIDIYDHFKNQFGTLSMLIKGNRAILTFENTIIKKHILQNPSIIIKGIPLTVKPFQEEQTRLINSDNSILPAPLTSFEPQNKIFQNLMMLGDSIQLPNIQQPLKLLQQQYDKKIKQIKSSFQDEQSCDYKIAEFDLFVKKTIKKNYGQFQAPFNSIRMAIKRYSLNPQEEPIDLEPKFTSSVLNTSINLDRDLAKNYNWKRFTEGLNYASQGVGSVKRLCLLNDSNFVTSLKLNEKYGEKGQLRIYHKNKPDPTFSLLIDEVPYSLMLHQNFILAGDFSGFIHFIDLENNNVTEFSNKLCSGLIVQMQKYDIKASLPSILTLVAGQRGDYKLKIFEIQKELINFGIPTLTFHPKEQMLCQGLTMTMEILDDGKFAYGCGRNTYIHGSLNKKQREYINHDQNVMKIKKRNAQEIIEALERKIILTDLRFCKIKNDIFDLPMDIKTFETISQTQLFYGGMQGQIGLVDIRKPQFHIWHEVTTHRGKIADILKIGNDVVTGNGSGPITEWVGEEVK